MIFDTDGGNLIEKELVAFGKTVSEPENPIKVGYSFGGWYLDEEMSEGYNFSSLVEDDLKLYAKWVPKKFTLHFHPNGGSGEMDSLTLEYNEELDLPDYTFTKASWSDDITDDAFAGWATTSNGRVEYSDGAELEWDLQI